MLRCVPIASRRPSPARRWARSSAAVDCSTPTIGGWPVFGRRRVFGRAAAWFALKSSSTDIDEPRADPWNSYYAARFAWPDDSAQLARGVSLARVKTEATRLEAPEFVDVESPAGHVTILTGGLPYHRRTGARMLDSLLVVRGERARQFNLGIGVDLPQPAAAALEFMTPPTLWLGEAPPPASSHGWLFHVDAKNVLATHWEPLVDDTADPDGTAGGRAPIKGFRARLLETAGRPAA